jgi:chemotaxis protein CheX
MSKPDLLPASLDGAAAGPLADLLRERLADGQPIALDGAQVDRVGLACLQVLLSARAAAIGGGMPFTIATPSETFTATIGLAGCPDLAGSLPSAGE